MPHLPRRAFLADVGMGFAGLALGSMLFRDGVARADATALGKPHFAFHEIDLSAGVPAEVVRGAEWVFHLAAMPGLTRSWLDFDTYHRHNLTGTHRLLEALKSSPTLDRLVYASTSSVYGKYASGDEALPTRPRQRCYS